MYMYFSFEFLKKIKSIKGSQFCFTTFNYRILRAGFTLRRRDGQQVTNQIYLIIFLAINYLLIKKIQKFKI